MQKDVTALQRYRIDATKRDHIDLSQSPVDKKWRAWKLTTFDRIGVPERRQEDCWVILATHKDKAECLRRAKRQLERIRSAHKSYSTAPHRPRTESLSSSIPSASAT